MLNTNKESREHWDFISSSKLPSEKDYFEHHFKKYLKVKEYIEESGPRKILDIGVGSGIFYSMLSDLSRYEIHGVEVVPEFIPLLTSRGVNAVQCNIEKEILPYPDGSFDLVICDSIIEHTLKPKKLLSEMSRVLKKGGSFILIAPNATSVVRRWNHVRGRNIFEPLIDNLYHRDYLSRCAVFYSIREIRPLLSDNGLRIDTIRYLDETSHDPKGSLALGVCRLLSRAQAPLRDVFLITGKKEVDSLIS